MSHGCWVTQLWGSPGVVLMSVPAALFPCGAVEEQDRGVRPGLCEEQQLPAGIPAAALSCRGPGEGSGAAPLPGATLRLVCGGGMGPLARGAPRGSCDSFPVDLLWPAAVPGHRSLVHGLRPCPWLCPPRWASRVE
uniref:Secreted protein n=1 Tax=Melopsittacus undulatus TaxID=13146 RepID=A0A8V5FGD3_MELUD